MKRLALLALLAACSSATAPGAVAASIVGNYQLVSVNGLSLPATVNTDGTIYTYSNATRDSVERSLDVSDDEAARFLIAIVYIMLSYAVLKPLRFIRKR